MNRDPQAWARLGRILKQTREHAGISQDELATRAGVSNASVQSAEYGKPPKGRMPPTIGKIARALGWGRGAVEAVLEGGQPSGEWRDISAPMPSKRLAAIFTNAMIRGTDTMTAAQIRTVTEIAIDQLREEGFISEEDTE